MDVLCMRAALDEVRRCDRSPRLPRLLLPRRRRQWRTALRLLRRLQRRILTPSCQSPQTTTRCAYERDSQVEDPV